MKKLRISQILVYYDHPEVFIAHDEVDTKFICLLVSSKKGIEYISTPISSPKLASFISGSIDLRNVFEHPEISTFYYFDKVDEIIEAHEYKETVLSENFLPAQGFIYKRPIENESVILTEAAERENAIIHLAISDEEDNYSIDAENLGDIVKLYQIMLENSYKKALSQRQIPEKKSFYTPNNYKVRAFASSRSSFNIHLYSTSNKNLLGETLIELGLEKIDEITQDISNQESYINSLRTVKGHTISTLKKLVKKLIEKNIKIKHKWYAPNQDKVHLTIIDKEKAEKIYQILNLREELSEEIKILIGVFSQVDVDRGTWRIHNEEDGKEYNGEATPESLQGITVETIKYELTCKEIIEEFKVSEKDKTKYVLQSIKKIEN